MGEFAPLRTGQLVVRFHAPWRRRLLLGMTVAGALLLLYVMYELGRFTAGYSVLSAAQDRRERAARIEVLEEQNEDLRARAAAAELGRSVDRQSYANVEKTLGELQAQVQRQREELTFYRGIVSPEDGVGGLRIQRLEVLPGPADGHYQLRLVLMQSMRQDAVVSGSVTIELEGSRDRQPLTLTLAEAGGAARNDVPFSFRYFQNLEQDVVLPEGFEPAAVNVELKTARQPPVRQSFPWQVLVAG